jgi:ABC-type dipeptide/oligopeptide/nickel transport system permease component
LGAYLVRRFFLMLLTLLGISVIIFVLLRVMPGNIVDILYDAAGYVLDGDKRLVETTHLRYPNAFGSRMISILVWERE